MSTIDKLQADQSGSPPVEPRRRKSSKGVAINKVAQESAMNTVSQLEADGEAQAIAEMKAYATSYLSTKQRLTASFAEELAKSQREFSESLRAGAKAGKSSEGREAFLQEAEQDLQSLFSDFSNDAS